MISRATLESDMRDHPKWLALSPLAYRLGVRLVLWAIHHSRAGFVPDFVVKEYAGTKVMAKKLSGELTGCGRKFGKAGILDLAEGGFVVHDLIAPGGEDDDSPGRRVLTKSEAGRIGGQASVEARRAASGSASPKQASLLRASSAEASESASGGASGLLDQAAHDPTYQDHSGSGSSGSESDPPSPPLPSAPEATGTASRRTRRAPSVALPSDLAVDSAMLEFASKKHWPEWWVHNRFERFCELAKAKSWRYADWRAAFRNFLVNEADLYNHGPAALAHLAPASAKPAPQDDAARRAAAAAVEAAAKAAQGAA